jgi:tRNA G18 (ribose-2'-O)-methylase SpoU
MKLLNPANMTFIIDNVRSASNIGSIFRTADSLGFNQILICGISATPPNKEILKTALGASESVAWQYFENTIDAILHLKQNRFTVVAIEQSLQSIMLNNFEMKENTNYAFVLGNEVEGVNAEVLELCDLIVEIPQLGIKKSLNVSVAAGIVAWHCLSQSIKL